MADFQTVPKDVRVPRDVPGVPQMLSFDFCFPLFKFSSFYKKKMFGKVLHTKC